MDVGENEMKKQLFVFVLAVGLSACGGGSSNSGTSSSNNSVTGIFLDAPVSGLSYSSVSKNGKTDSSGQYDCVSGEKVTFKIGALPIGDAVCDSIITPYDLEGTTDIEDVKSINIVRLLTALDEDSNSNNGISLIAAAQSYSGTSVSFDNQESIINVLHNIDSSRSLVQYKT